MTGRAAELTRLSDQHAAHNYHPLPVVIDEAEGAWVTDVDGRRYLDMLAAYSALSGEPAVATNTGGCGRV